MTATGTPALARELDRTRTERDAYAAALAEVTHDFDPLRTGSSVCFVCGGLDGPLHQTPSRVHASLALGTPGATS